MKKEQFAHYTLGIPMIDDDHWYLISLLEKLNKPGIDQMALAVEFRGAFDAHCKREEDYMESIGFPYIESHRLEHKRLADRVELAIKRVFAGYADEFIGNRLITEMTDHIDQYDMQVVYCMNKD